MGEDKEETPNEHWDSYPNIFIFQVIIGLYPTQRMSSIKRKEKRKNESN